MGSNAGIRIAVPSSLLTLMEIVGPIVLAIALL
jgi:hypothetical protein